MIMTCYITPYKECKEEHSEQLHFLTLQNLHVVPEERGKKAEKKGGRREERGKEGREGNKPEALPYDPFSFYLLLLKVKRSVLNAKLHFDLTLKNEKINE